MAHSTHGNSLWKVLGLYGAGSWVVLQVIDVLAQNSGLPSWVFNLALILLIMGLPVVGATAYLHGLGRRQDTESADGEAGVTPTAPRQLFTWKNAIGGGMAAMALWGVLVTGWLFFGPGVDSGAAGRDAASAAADSAAVADLRSVAVLPFATRSADEADEYFSEGMHDDVLTQLSKIDSLTVISRTSVMQYAGTTKSIPEIADELGVATILEGGIQRSGRSRADQRPVDRGGDGQAPVGRDVRRGAHGRQCVRDSVRPRQEDRGRPQDHALTGRGRAHRRPAHGEHRSPRALFESPVPDSVWRRPGPGRAGPRPLGAGRRTRSPATPGPGRRSVLCTWS